MHIYMQTSTFSRHLNRHLPFGSVYDHTNYLEHQIPPPSYIFIPISGVDSLPSIFSRSNSVSVEGGKGREMPIYSFYNIEFRP